MALSFPSNPTVGQQSTQNGRTYQWSGYAWEIVASSVSLDASQITSGTVAAARLGSGTANNTTFLRGDSTFAAPAAVFDFTRTSAPAGTTGSAPGPYTWSIPAGARALTIIAISGGGGGGSGRRGAADTLAGGGGGGGNGDVKRGDWLISELPATTLHITIGNGSPGGAARTTDNTDGVAGGAANVSVVRLTDASGDQIVANDSYGWRGSGGTSTAGGAAGGARR